MAVKIDGTATGGAYSLIEYAHAAGAPGPPPHVHREHEEAFRVLDGELTLDVGDRTLTLGPGDYAVVPRGMEHRPYNVSDAEVRFLFITSPALDGFFAEMADLNAATGGSPCGRGAEGAGRPLGLRVHRLARGPQDDADGQRVGRGTVRDRLNPDRPLPGRQAPPFPSGGRADGPWPVRP